MNTKLSARYWIYLSLSIVGLVTAWTFNGLAVMNNQDYTAAWFGTAVDWVLSADLSIVAIAGVIFMITEGRRLGMKRIWLTSCSLASRQWPLPSLFF